VLPYRGVLQRVVVAVNHVRALALRLAAACAAAAAALAAASPAAAQAPSDCDPATLGPVPGEVVVGYSTPVVPPALRARLALEPVEYAIDDRPPYYARIGGVEPDGALARVIAGLPGIRFVEPNSRLCVSAPPSDPLLGQMWTVGSTLAGAGLQAAWDRAPAGAVTVAVLDTGIDLDHPDLAPNAWVNPEDPPGGGDQDGNGITDDVHGANTIARSGAVADDQGHGTFVAGIVGARGDNGIGIAGAAWQARLMAVKTMDGAGRGVATDTADGIRYAVDQGARILNLSVNGDAPDTVHREAIEYAGARGAVVVASAGNQSRDIDATPSYPASWRFPYVVGVAATRQGGDLAAFSNRGPASLELAAPGEAVTSTTRGGDYGLGSGTSFAAPHVSGALALLAGARPDLGAAGLLDHLFAGARAPGGLPVGVGRLDAGAAMARAVGAAPGGGATGAGGGPAVVVPTSPAGARRPAAARPRIAIRLTGVSKRLRAGRRILRWTVTGDVGRIRSAALSVGGRRVAELRVPAASTRLVLRTRVRLAPGRRTLRLALRDEAGATLGSRTARVVVRRAR